MNKTGPSIKPCGTPLRNSHLLESLIVVYETDSPGTNYRNYKQNLNQLTKAWSTLSKAYQNQKIEKCFFFLRLYDLIVIIIP